MERPRLLAVWLPLLVLVLTAIGAPLPVPKRKPLYFPTRVGATWVYERPGGEEESVAVDAVEEVKGGLVVSRKGVAGTSTAYLKVVVSPEGLRQEAKGSDRVGWVLKVGLKPGESWEDPNDGTRTVHGPEAVEVPAGRFVALRVVCREGGGTFTSWYAPGVGEVKRVVIRGGEETVFRTLKSFKLK